jgi:hypothetical protein
MVEYYHYVENTTDGSYLQQRIFPEESRDQPYVDVEQLTGVGVRVYYGFTSNIGLQQDYFFPDFYQPKPGTPLFFPYYSLLRYLEYSPHQVEEVFGALKVAQQLQIGLRVSCLITGALFVLISFWILYKQHSLSRKNKLISNVVQHELETPMSSS